MTIILQEDFEAGNLSKFPGVWTTGNGTVSANTVAALRGSYGVQMSVPAVAEAGADLAFYPIAQSDLYATAKMLFKDTLPRAPDWLGFWTLVSIADTPNWTKMVTVRIRNFPNQHVYWEILYIKNGQVVDTIIETPEAIVNANVEYTVVLHAKFGTTDGAVELFVNGVRVYSDSGFEMSAVPPYVLRIGLDPHDSTLVYAQTIYMDDMMIADQLTPTAMGTFGQTETGDTADGVPCNNKQMSRFQAPANGIIIKLTLYCWIATGMPVVKGVIYSDNAGVPNALLGVSAETAVPAGATWLDLTGGTIGINITAGTWYWLGFIVGKTGTDGINEKCQSGVSGITVVYNGDTYSDGPANPAGDMTLGFNETAQCIYATYMTSGGPVVLRNMTFQSIVLNADGSQTPVNTTLTYDGNQLATGGTVQVQEGSTVTLSVPSEV